MFLIPFRFVVLTKEKYRPGVRSEPHLRLRGLNIIQRREITLFVDKVLPCCEIADLRNKIGVVAGVS